MAQQNTSYLKTQHQQKKRQRSLQRNRTKTGKRFHNKYLKLRKSSISSGPKIRFDQTETWLEKFVSNYLSTKGIKYQKEYEIYGRFYDFYLPEYNLLIEAHGDYWHANPLIYGSEEKKKPNLRQIADKINDVFKRCVAKTKDINLVAIYESAMNEKNLNKALEYFKNKSILDTWEYMEICE